MKNKSKLILFIFFQKKKVTNMKNSLNGHDQFLLFSRAIERFAKFSIKLSSKLSGQRGPLIARIPSGMRPEESRANKTRSKIFTI